MGKRGEGVRRGRRGWEPQSGTADFSSGWVLSPPPSTRVYPLKRTGEKTDGRKRRNSVVSWYSECHYQVLHQPDRKQIAWSALSGNGMIGHFDIYSTTSAFSSAGRRFVEVNKNCRVDLLKKETLSTSTYRFSAQYWHNAVTKVCNNAVLWNSLLQWRVAQTA